MIVSARPMMKPLSTGSEMNEAMKPSRSRPARTQSPPTTIASAAVVVAKSAPPPCAMSPTTLAERAAVPDMVATTRCREEPSSGYNSSAGTAAYRPTTGDTPAIVA
jgi:hypothetical protein